MLQVCWPFATRRWFVPSLALACLVALTPACRTAVISDETDASDDDDDDDEEDSTTTPKDNNSSASDDENTSTTSDNSSDEGGESEEQSSMEESSTSDATSNDDDSSATDTTSTSETSGETDTSNETDSSSEDLCAGDQPVVRLTTNQGVMEVTLDRVNAPITVENFLRYVTLGRYDGVIFHRVIDDFVIQTGGFRPGMEAIETFDPIQLEISEELRHVDGALGMARLDQPDTADSQFYLCDGAQAGLDDMYAVFGVLTSGKDVLQKIAAVMTAGQDVPVQDVVLTEAICVAP